jgi:glycosyltransferase involved in cell wall biosynthesis
MRILFVHQNFPGQFKHLAPALAARGHRVVALCARAKVPEMPGVRVVRYSMARRNAPGVHPWAHSFELKMIYAEAAARAAERMRAAGFVPDLIYAHTGWGESLGLKTIWPNARLVGFFEFYYHAHGADVDFDPEFPGRGWTTDVRVEMKNAAHLAAMNGADAGIAPTEYQRSTFPGWFRSRLEVVHDGIDTAEVKPDPNASFPLPGNSGTLRPGDEVVTFVSRRLEPLRGCHIFLRSLPEILRRRPRARVVIVGATEGTGYGLTAPKGKTWRDVFLAEIKGRADLSRVHFLGRVPYGSFLRLLQVSAAHVYLTYPFVLSWSLLEAMASGCLVVGSRTAPVCEAIEDGRNGRLVDFFDVKGLADAVVEALEKPAAFRRVREAARQSILARYDLKSLCLPRQIQLLESGYAARGKESRS